MMSFAGYCHLSEHSSFVAARMVVKRAISEEFIDKVNMQKGGHRPQDLDP